METESTKSLVRGVTERLDRNVKIVRRRLGRPLTLAEKVLLGHLADPEKQELGPGRTILALQPDRVAMQDATAQMALLQFTLAGRMSVAVPTTVHCDHLIRAFQGADDDMKTALNENREVYEFLRSVSKKYGIGFWGPGAGIIHQVIFEKYAFPGGLMIGTDSHTPNAGGLGMIAVGVGGADAVDAMVGMPWEVLHPKIVGVKLTGSLNGWAAPKDVILKVCELLTTKGGTNRIIEYFGPGARSISCTGKGTITNMGAELGATTSIFPFDEAMKAYLEATERKDLAHEAEKNKALLTADPEVEERPEKFFERVIEIDLSKLEPHIVGPHSPDVARPVSLLKKEVREKNYPDRLSVALIGSCTNSSYEDIERAAGVARQAKRLGLKAVSKLLVTPGSEQIRATIERDGQLKDLEEIGATVLANACGPCIGQWQRQDTVKGESNSILTSYNRNFPKRNDGNPQTLAFIGSPEVVVALGLAGRLSFDPQKDTLSVGGREVRLDPPPQASPIPKRGFVFSTKGFEAPAADGSRIEVIVHPQSERLQLITPFSAWDGHDFEKLPLLGKMKGQCTTDHISPAGPWLKYRGHLDKISDNAFIGAINAFTGEAGAGLNQLTKEKGQPFPKIARAYKQAGSRWVVVGGENYGEGSSREHAAMSPRYLGCAAVIVKSFARIHETNLKKQGILPLTFSNPADYEKVRETDRISITGLKGLAPGKRLKIVLHHEGGQQGNQQSNQQSNQKNNQENMKTDEIEGQHSFTADQIEWFKAGNALNLLRQRGN